MNAIESGKSSDNLRT